MPRKPPHNRDTSGLAAHAQRKAAEARRNVTEAIDRLVATNEAVNFNTVAKAAGVTKSYLYDQEDFRERIEALRRQGVAPALRIAAGAPVQSRTEKTKDILLAAKDQRIKELEAENRKLKEELKTILGKVYEAI